MELTPKQRLTIIGAALLTLFVGAMDALIVSAAMPTVVADLGGLHLFSWVYTTFFLARTISLPIVGKLADLYSRRTLLLASVGAFTLASLGAGCAWNMELLIATRILQGLSSGGVMALVYIVLVDVSEPEKRARSLSLGSSVWGIASVLGPTLVVQGVQQGVYRVFWGVTGAAAICLVLCWLVPRRKTRAL